MKIALLTDGIWPFSVGGMQKHSYYLCKYFAASGVDVHLFYTDKNHNVSQNFDDVFTSQELIHILPEYVEYPASIYFPGHYLYESYEYSKRIYLKLQKFVDEYAILYIQGFSGWATLKNNIGQARIYPSTLLNLHGLEMFQEPQTMRARFEQFLFKPFARLQLKRSDHVQSLGKNLTTLLRTQQIPPSKIFECAIGIEKSWLSEIPIATASTRSFCFIGRNERRKGIPTLNQALNMLVDDDCEFEMIFIGPVPASEQILDRRIRYYGLINDEQAIKEILDRVHFLVVPSYSEGMPTVILEGMARGCAVIASNVGVVDELVDAENGFLVLPGKEDELYKAMTKAICLGQDELVVMRTSSVNRVKGQFTWDLIIQKMIRGINSMLKLETREQAV